MDQHMIDTEEKREDRKLKAEAEKLEQRQLPNRRIRRMIAKRRHVFKHKGAWGYVNNRPKRDDQDGYITAKQIIITAIVSILVGICIPIALFIIVANSANAAAPTYVEPEIVQALPDHSNCQYPNRLSNPVNGCDNSDPANPQCMKVGTETCDIPADTTPWVDTTKPDTSDYYDEAGNRYDYQGNLLSAAPVEAAPAKLCTDK